VTGDELIGLENLGAEKREEVVQIVKEWCDCVHIETVGAPECVTLVSVRYALVVDGVSLYAEKTVKAHR